MMLIQIVTLSKAWVCVRKHAGVAGSNGRHECLFRVSVVCCQVDVCCIGLIPVQGLSISCECCVLSDVFCIGLITRPEVVYFV
jgi:hypothetical protein